MIEVANDLRHQAVDRPRNLHVLGVSPEDKIGILGRDVSWKKLGYGV